MNENRRNFLKIMGITAGAGALGVLSGIRMPNALADEKAKGAALPAGEKLVSENDAVAKAIGYKHNIKDIDYKKYPKRKEKAHAHEFCENCQLYTKVNEGYGKCMMMPTSGLVEAKGWCGSWAAKAKK